MPRMAVTRIAKSYDGNPAVREISFAAEAGQVLALCGENGAGKSTLMKMLSGAITPDSGEIMLDGVAVRIDGPAAAIAHGICTVYQELSLLPHLSVAENMLLGRMPMRAWSLAVDWPQANRIAGKVLADFGFPNIDPRALVRTQSVAQQQVVEIAKALVVEPRILILDEPTAVLSASETAKLFDKIRKLAAGGTTILYISHRLEEIFTIAEAVVVLKDGLSVLAAKIGEVDQERLIHAMVGRPLATIFPPKTAHPGKIVLDVEHLSRRGVFEDISFSVRAGEIVGMFGLVGSGRTEIAKAVFGAIPADAGEIRLKGKNIASGTPASSVRAGIAMLTEDRKGDGLALPASVMDNAGLASFGRFSRYGVIDHAKRRALVTAKINELAIRPRDTSRPVRQLSGGNQQKVVIAKWLLAEGIELFIFDEPTRGVDIAAKVEIYRMIRMLAESGTAVLLISSELPEVLGLSDRLLVVRLGRVVAELAPETAGPETVFAYAGGLPVQPLASERLQ